MNYIIQVSDYFFDFSDMTYWNKNSTKNIYTRNDVSIRYNRLELCWEFDNGDRTWNKWKDYAIDFDDNSVTKQYLKWLKRVIK